MHDRAAARAGRRPGEKPTGDLNIQVCRPDDYAAKLPLGYLRISTKAKRAILPASQSSIDVGSGSSAGISRADYNLRMPGGANANEGFNSSRPVATRPATAPTFAPAREQAPQALATLCLQAMGEQNYDVSALLNDARPEVDWSWTNPAEALQALCEGLGCRVVYWLADDRVQIVTIGQGQPLPDNGLQTFISQGVDPPNTPSSRTQAGRRPDGLSGIHQAAGGRHR